MGIGAVGSTLRYRRLKWLRQLIRDGRKHVLASAFGRFPWDARDPVSETGSPQPEAHAWVKLVAGDLERLWQELGVGHLEAFAPGWEGRLASCEDETLKRYVIMQTGQEPEQLAILDRPFQCRVQGCNSRFPTAVGRACHEWKAHGVRDPRRVQVTEPRCPGCGAVFSCTQAAKRHWQRGSCGRKGGNGLAGIMGLD